MRESKDKRNEWIEEYIDKENEKSKKIKNIMSNNTYIEWLSQFTQDKDRFFDNDWLYFPEEISELDRKNVDILNLFYEGIDKYAQQNYIYPISCDFGHFYRVRLNDFGFEIGMLFGQSTVFFFNKVQIDKKNKFIDFNDITSNKKRNNVDQINCALDMLSNTIINAYKSGVPIEAIANTIDNTVRNITPNKEDKVKKLVIK